MAIFPFVLIFEIIFFFLDLLVGIQDEASKHSVACMNAHLDLNNLFELCLCSESQPLVSKCILNDATVSFDMRDMRDMRWGEWMAVLD